MLAFITGTVDQELLLRNEYLVATKLMFWKKWKMRRKFFERAMGIEPTSEA